MNIKVLGHIDAEGNVHGLDELCKRASMWAIIGNREYMRKVTGELYRVTRRKNGDAAKLTPIRYLQRAR